MTIKEIKDSLFTYNKDKTPFKTGYIDYSVCGKKIILLLSSISSIL